MHFDAQEREEYESQLKWLRIEMSTLKKANDEGRAEGIKQGLEARRREQAKIEGMRMTILKIAQNMKNRGLPDDQIMLFTGLSLEEIQENMSS
ncbi:MAG: hypothetical protein QRY72_00115 [Candidatus Rhabdochlamydia sp.]